MERIYLDHNATTAPDPRVREAMLEALGPGFGNPSSLHWFGQQARRLVEEAREAVAAFLGAPPLEIYFTSGGTESNYLALQGAALAKGQQGRIITSAIEHPSVLEATKNLGGRGFEIVLLPATGTGKVTPEAVAAALTDDTILVSIMAANNETGVVQPIREIGELVKARGILFHTDAVQYAGKLEIDVRSWPVDMLSISGHKFYGPKGIGALWVKKGVKLAPRQKGGGQEMGLRGGTENVPGIVGLGAAAKIARAELPDWKRKIGRLRDRLESEVLAQVPQVVVHGREEARVPNTTNLSFLGAEGEAVLLSLDLSGVAVSTGSACSTGSNEPSHVLRAMNLPPEESRCSIRFALGKDNTDSEIERTVAVVSTAVERIRAIAGT